MPGLSHVEPRLRLLGLLLAALALPACGGDEGGGEPALIAAGTGIPMGARGAEGAQFNAPAAGEGSLTEQPAWPTKPPKIKAPPPPDPSDPLTPFGPEELPETDGGAPPTTGPKPKKKGTQL